MAKASPKTNTTVNPSDEELLAGGKGRPTPSRKEREAANRRPLVGGTREDKKVARGRLTNEREKARVGMANGDERYLQAKDRGDQRRYIRGYIDARWNVGEVLVPIMVLVVLLSFLQNTGTQSLSLIVIWAFFVVLVVDCLIAGMLVNRRIKRKWGDDAVQRGNLWYVAVRASQMRFLRLPKPQVKRGQYPV